MREDIALPHLPEELADKIICAFKDEKVVQVCVLKAMGQEQIVSMKIDE
jgi:hypothetical protein